MNGENLPIVCPRRLKWSPRILLKNLFDVMVDLRSTNSVLGFRTCHFYTPLSVQCHPKYSLACICSSKSSSYYAWQEYNVVKSNWRGMLTVDIWAQLYSLVMTSKPYFRTEKPVYLYLFLCIPSVVLSVELKKKRERRTEQVSPTEMTVLQRQRAWRWILFHVSDHCPFREASANQEALQSPNPTPPLLLPPQLFHLDELFIFYCFEFKLCLWFVWYLCCCDLQSCFVVYLMCRHVKSIFVCFRLPIPLVYFGICCWTLRIDGYSENAQEHSMYCVFCTK